MNKYDYLQKRGGSSEPSPQDVQDRAQFDTGSNAIPRVGASTFDQAWAELDEIDRCRRKPSRNGTWRADAVSTMASQPRRRISFGDAVRNRTRRVNHQQPTGPGDYALRVVTRA